jgi:TRAP-type C4-dicarboxylate transport system permease small subunit
LVFTDQLDANTAIDTSENLIKDYYIRTFFLSAYAFIFVVFLFMITSGIKMVFPEYYKMLPVMAWEGITVGLVALLGPWSFALMLAQLYDLQLRKTKIITPTAKDKVSAI